MGERARRFALAAAVAVLVLVFGPPLVGALGGVQETRVDGSATIALDEGDRFGIVRSGKKPMICDIASSAGVVLIDPPHRSPLPRAFDPALAAWFSGEAVISCDEPVTLLHTPYYVAADVSSVVAAGALAAGVVAAARRPRPDRGEPMGARVRLTGRPRRGEA